MLPHITDSQFNSVALVVVALITIIPVTLTAFWSRSAQKNSAAAKVSAAEAADQVRTNGGMSDPNPNLNDHVKYQTELLEKLQDVPYRLGTLETAFEDHVAVANTMGRGMAEMYLHIMGREAPKLYLDRDR